MGTVRIHGIMMVKDEGDVVGETLEAAQRWCDAIYVFDNGSTDGTWECVLRMADQSDRVVPFKQDAVPFNDSLRGEVFRYYQDRAEPGDWWCILDGDEIYIDDPREFLAAVPERYGEVWSSSYQYYFTDADLDQYEADPEGYLATRVEDRSRYYLNNWSESRFIRHHRGLVWPEDHGEQRYWRPLGIGATFPRRIRLKHYQYRSPEQMEARLRSRMAIAGSYRHERQPDWLARLLGRRVPAEELPRESTTPTWRDRIVPARYLQYDAGDSHYVSDEAALPRIGQDRYHVRQAKRRMRATLWRVRAAVRQTARR